MGMFRQSQPECSPCNQLREIHPRRRRGLVCATGAWPRAGRQDRPQRPLSGPNTFAGRDNDNGVRLAIEA
jgi:hypothetical protein